MSTDSQDSVPPQHVVEAAVGLVSAYLAAMDAARPEDNVIPEEQRRPLVAVVGPMLDELHSAGPGVGERAYGEIIHALLMAISVGTGKPIMEIWGEFVPPFLAAGQSE